jgi:hypothetical protein
MTGKGKGDVSGEKAVKNGLSFSTTPTGAN